MGDYVMKFNDFSVLVDCKNFKKSNVSNVDIEKLKRDMVSNPSIKVAWMVSIDRPISRYDYKPFVFEIEDNKCYL